MPQTPLAKGTSSGTVSRRKFYPNLKLSRGWTVCNNYQLKEDLTK